MSTGEQKKRYLALYQLVRDVLWQEWDPIGVNKLSTADDEYDSYAPPLVHMLLDGASPESIAQQLIDFEGNAIGLSNTGASLNRAFEVAERLCAIRDSVMN